MRSDCALSTWSINAMGMFDVTKARDLAVSVEQSNTASQSDRSLIFISKEFCSNGEIALANSSWLSILFI